MSNTEKTSAKILETSLIEIWNERNSTHRREIMEKIYTQDIIFFEIDKEWAGIDVLNDRITQFQSEFPENFRFTHPKPAEITFDLIRCFWAWGTAGDVPKVTGMDSALIVDGKIQRLYLYIDQA